MLSRALIVTESEVAYLEEEEVTLIGVPDGRVLGDGLKQRTPQQGKSRHLRGAETLLCGSAGAQCLHEKNVHHLDRGLLASHTR